jgi:hypothetical protein
MVFFLAALTRGLFSRVLGADDASFRPVMGKRGESGVTVGAGSSSRASITEAASASETPSRWARAVRERAGASPRARSAASNTGNRTWIHLSLSRFMAHDASKARRPRAGWWTVHCPAVLLARVPGFHQCDCGEVAAPRSIL